MAVHTYEVFPAKIPTHWDSYKERLQEEHTETSMDTCYTIID